MGKSSTINALCHSKKVSVSATPGKTKYVSAEEKENERMRNGWRCEETSVALVARGRMCEELCEGDVVADLVGFVGCQPYISTRAKTHALLFLHAHSSSLLHSFFLVCLY